MNKILNLQINKQSQFELWTKEEDSFTYFTEIIIYYVDEKGKVIVFDDFLGEAITNLTGTLDSLLNGKCELSFGLCKGSIGHDYNRNTFSSLKIPSTESSDDDSLSKHWLWSAKRVQTWAYNLTNSIYLEISPSYPWFYSDPEEGEALCSFDGFMKTYQTIADFELDKNTAEHWQHSTQQLLNQIQQEVEA